LLLHVSAEAPPSHPSRARSMYVEHADSRVVQHRDKQPEKENDIKIK
jgi:hypothetical protein